jgi:hypothetical protein
MNPQESNTDLEKQTVAGSEKKAGDETSLSGDDIIKGAGQEDQLDKLKNAAKSERGEHGKQKDHDQHLPDTTK